MEKMQDGSRDEGWVEGMRSGSGLWAGAGS